MKSLHLNTNKQVLKLLLLGIFFIGSPLWAKDRVVVQSVEGRVFAMLGEDVWEIQPKEVLPDFVEIVTEEGSQVELYDFNDNKIILSGSSHLAVLNKIFELKRGYVWVQAFNKESVASIQTPNANTSLTMGGVIVSFDGASGKSQSLVVSGEAEFSNLLESRLLVNLQPGQFSFVDNEYEKGIPRRPTPVGFASFKKVFRLFNDVRPMERNQALFGPLEEEMLPPGSQIVENHVRPKTAPAPTRAPASKDILAQISQSPAQRVQTASAEGTKPGTMNKVVTAASSNVPAGKIIVIKREPDFTRAPSSFSQEKLYKEKITEIKIRKKKRDPRDYSKYSGVSLKVFGAKKRIRVAQKRKWKSKKGRVPASQTQYPFKEVPGPVKVAPIFIYDPINYREPSETRRPTVDPFEKSLLKEYKSQMRHTNEVNQLIDELKSYDQNYKKQY